MDGTLKAVIALLSATDAETRCAALLVLTRLESAEDRVVRAVAEALGAKNALVRDFALGFFEGVRPRGGLPWLTPLLDSADDAVRLRAVDILAAYGAPAVSAATKGLNEATRRRLSAAIALCTRVQSAPALDALFRLMAADDIDASRAACEALVSAIPGATPRVRTEVFKRTDQLAARARGQRGPAVAAAKLFAALQEPKARKRLFGMLGKGSPEIVRSHALSALAQCLRGQKLAPSETDTLLTELERGGEAALVRPAIQLLEDQTFERGELARLNRLAESPEPYVKRFAVQKLGSFDSGAVVKTLIGYLTDDSYARRDQATSSLKNLPAARSSLMKEFLSCDEERKAWTLADILLVHDRTWKRDVLDAIGKKLEQALERGEDRLYSAYAHFLLTLDAQAFAERVHARVERLRKRKDFRTALKWLGLLKDSPVFDDETRFSLLVTELKAHKRSASAVARRHDPAVELARELVRSGFPVAARLRRDRLLTPEELFSIAFPLAEGRPEELPAAEEILEHLKARYGRTKAGKAARNKLSLLAARR